MTLTDPDWWRLASLMVRWHGERAWVRCMERRQQAVLQKDEELAAAWRRIAELVATLLEEEPVEDMAIH